MGNRKLATIVNFQNKALGVSQKFLDADLLITEGNIIRMNPITLGVLVLEYTLNGTDYYSVNAGIAQAAEGSYMYRIMCTAGDLFNLRIKSGVVTTVKNLKVELWLEA